MTSKTKETQHTAKECREKEDDDDDDKYTDKKIYSKMIKGQKRDSQHKKKTMKEKMRIGGTKTA